MRCVVIVGCILCLLLCGCSSVEREITCQEIIDAYEAAGYEVFHKEDSGYDYDCYIYIEDPESGDCIYFHRFPTAVEAQSYAETRQYHVLIWVFSAIYGDPTWVHTTTYREFEIEYDNEDLYEPFAGLLAQ